MTTHDQIAKASKSLLDQLPSLSIEQIELLVRHHNHAYFEKNAPEITDEAFDKLVEALRYLEPDSRILEEIEIGVVRGRSANAVVHLQPMLSLDKVYDDESFLKWREKINGDLIAMPKIDGVACSIHYDVNGHLHLAATRGDGRQGENITTNAKRIEVIPNRIDLAEKNKAIEVRGEVYMKLSRFAQHYKEQFANPRNLAAGALKQKEADRSAAYKLSFFPYDVHGLHLETEKEKFELLRTLGFDVPPVELADSVEECKKTFLHFAKMRPDLDYEIDGVVFRANRVSEQSRLGVTAHHPRWTIAFKFQGESAQTRLVDVEWSVGRTGVITPVAIVQPVYVSGATVTRASLHNLGLFNKHHLTQNALVEIVRRGGVIPHVERVLRASGETFMPPSRCPSCGGGVVVDGDFLRCENPSACPSIGMARIEHFCAVLDIQGFGEKLIRSLIQNKLVKSPADLYRLKEENLLVLDRMGEKLASKLVKEINAKREIDLSLFLTALGFDEIGPTIAESIVAHYKNLEALRNAKFDELSSIYGVGKSIANALVSNFEIFQSEIDDLLTEVKIVNPQEKKRPSSGHPLFDKGVVFTGTMVHLERKEAQKRVRALGGKTPATLTSSTDYLVIGDEGSALLGDGEKSTKHKKAEKLIAAGDSIQIISESQFMKLLEAT